MNQFAVPHPYDTSKPLVCKAYQFQRFATEKAVATDDVYYCNEKGQILDIDFRKYKTFREGTLFGLLEVTPVDRRNRPVALSKQKAIMDGNVDEDEDEMMGRGSSLHKRDGTQVSSQIRQNRRKTI